jgi:hypothetical protein
LHHSQNVFSKQLIGSVLNIYFKKQDNDMQSCDLMLAAQLPDEACWCTSSTVGKQGQEFSLFTNNAHLVQTFVCHKNS